jgi:hypothetical protein
MRDIDTEHVNFLKESNEEKIVALARAEALYETLEKSHDEKWKYSDIDDRRMLRIGKVGANETMAKMKGKTPVATTKVSGTAKPKLWLSEFTGDQMRCFGWPKQ